MWGCLEHIHLELQRLPPFDRPDDSVGQEDREPEA